MRSGNSTASWIDAGGIRMALDVTACAVAAAACAAALMSLWLGTFCFAMHQPCRTQSFLCEIAAKFGPEGCQYPPTVEKSKRTAIEALDQWRRIRSFVSADGPGRSSMRSTAVQTSQIRRERLCTNKFRHPA